MHPLMLILPSHGDVSRAPKDLNRYGCPLPDAPRTNPSEPDSGTGLLPRVSDGEAHVWPRVLGWIMALMVALVLLG